jgi:hypothetical protein
LEPHLHFALERVLLMAGDERWAHQCGGAGRADTALCDRSSGEFETVGGGL